MWIEFYDISEPTLPSCGNGTRLHMWNVNLKIFPLWWGLAYMAQLLWICLRLPPQEHFLKLLRDVIDNFKLRLTDRWIPGHIRTFTVIQWNWNSSTHMNRKNILPSTMAWNLGLKNISFWKEPVRLAAKILYYDAMGLALVDWGQGIRMLFLLALVMGFGRSGPITPISKMSKISLTSGKGN